MNINQALLKAVEAYKSGDVEAAKRLFSKIIQIEPNHPDANSKMGSLLVASGDLEEALPDPPPLNWSTPIVRNWRIKYGNQAIQTRRDCNEAKAG